MKLGLALGWHALDFAELREAARLAERLGYAALYVDGDVSVLPSLGDAPVLDGWTVTTALLAGSERIPIGSIRLVHHWNAAKLAQAAATQEALHPGRLRFFASVGGQPGDRRFGLRYPEPAERIHWLDETLHAVRALWRGETVSMRGSHVVLDEARVRPTPPGGGLPIEIAARGARLLGVVAEHADRWDVNLPALHEPVAAAARRLEAACRERGRDPASIERSLWIFTRPDRDPDDPALRAEYRRFNPWFADLPDADLGRAIVAGSAAHCRTRLAELAEALSLDLPVADLSGLPYDAARQAIAALAP